MFLKITLFCVFGVMQCVYVVRGSKNKLFFTYCTLLLLLYAPPFWNASIFTKLIILRSEAVLWLASYPVRCDWPNTSSVWRKCYAPLPYCDAVSWLDETKTIKPIINEAFVASSGDIITDYNELYCIFTCCIAHYHVCICVCRNTKQALLYTAQNSCLNSQ